MPSEADSDRSGAVKEPFMRGHGTTTPVGRVTPGPNGVDVRGRIRRCGRRRLPDGEVVTEGHIVDTTGEIPFIAWTPRTLRPGDVVEIRGASTSTWHGRVQLELDDGTTVVRLGAPVRARRRPPAVELSDLCVGDRAVETRGTVLASNDDTVDLANGTRAVRRGVLGDRTVRLPFIDWSGDDRMGANHRVRISNGYVTAYRGIRSVNLTTSSSVTSRGDTPSPPDSLPVRRIRDLRALGSSLDVSAEANVLRILGGSGLIGRCPTCGRALRERRCRQHGPVEPTHDLRVKAVLDDGTESLTLVLGAEITASIYGAGVEEVRKEAHGRMDDPVTGRISRAIVGRMYRVGGRLSVDDEEARLTAERFTPLRGTPNGRARRVLEGLAT